MHFNIRTFKLILIRKLSHTKLMFDKTYSETIESLNDHIKNFGKRKDPVRHIAESVSLLNRTGLQLSDLDHFPIVHVAGTKGKGSTCTYIDSILHRNGYKTGLYMSPHLKEVRERIRINGSPISKSMFCDVYWKIYNRLNATRTSEDDTNPFYFQFLTLMAFHVFKEEKVDYIIIETGLGGRFDTTNMIPRSTISCITSIGMDHMEFLGNTLSQIAWNKAGIIKENGLVITCDNQAEEVLDVIQNEAREKKALLYIAPVGNLDIKNKLNFSEFGNMVHLENAVLATAVCQLLLNKNFNIPKDNSKLNIAHIPKYLLEQSPYQKIIDSTVVNGRYQFIQRDNVQYFIDGAHTLESIKTTIQWFKSASPFRKNNSEFEDSDRYLIFMMTGKRKPLDLLEQLLEEFDFKGILLTPLVPSTTKSSPDFGTDQMSFNRDGNKIAEISATWQRICFLKYKTKSEEYMFNSFSDITEWFKSQPSKKFEVLVTGSLHLVGCALEVLQEE